MLTQTNNSNSLLHFIKKYQNLLSVFVILLFALTVLRSAFYGISTPDESFYLTIPYRLIKGDALLADEWHASQFSAFLLYLPMKVYMMITGSTDGMLLYFRCVFVFCQTAVSLFTFGKLRKKYGTLSALISAVIFLLYVPETVNMLDYYTMSLMGFQVVTLILFCSEKLSAPKLIFCGIVFACVVIAQPFNCLIYFLYTAAVIIFEICRKRKGFSELTKLYLAHKTWAYITIGIITVAAVFSVFLFSQLTFKEFIDNIGNLFGGHDHTLPFAETGKTDMFSYITIFKSVENIAPLGFYAVSLFLLLLLWDKNRLKRRSLWLLVTFILIIILVTENCISSFQNFAAILFKPYILFILTFVCLVLTKEKDRKLYMILWSGIVYIFFLGIISQALNYVGVIGFVISNTALAPSLIQLYKEFKPSESYESSQKNSVTPTIKLLCFISAIVISFDVISGTSIKFIDDTTAYAFGRSTLSADTVIEKGPLKGIHVNSDVKNEYNSILSDIETIKENSCERVLVAGLIPWIYFSFEEPPAAFTTWYIEEEFGLYEEYYKNEEKIPQCIYVPKISLYWGYDYTGISESHKEFFSQMFTVEQTDGKSGYILFADNA